MTIIFYHGEESSEYFTDITTTISIIFGKKLLYVTVCNVLEFFFSRNMFKNVFLVQCHYCCFVLVTTLVASLKMIMKSSNYLCMHMDIFHIHRTLLFIEIKKVLCVYASLQEWPWRCSPGRSCQHLGLWDHWHLQQWSGTQKPTNTYFISVIALPCSYWGKFPRVNQRESYLGLNFRGVLAC